MYIVCVEIREGEILPLTQYQSEVSFAQKQIIPLFLICLLSVLLHFSLCHQQTTSNVQIKFSIQCTNPNYLIQHYNFLFWLCSYFIRQNQRLFLASMKIMNQKGRKSPATPKSKQTFNTHFKKCASYEKCYLRLSVLITYSNLFAIH